MRITGTIVYQPIEGGFWGIAGDDQVNYEPVDSVPASLQRDNTRIEADVEPVDASSFRMWGRPVRILSIKRQ